MLLATMELWNMIIINYISDKYLNTLLLLTFVWLPLRSIGLRWNHLLVLLSEARQSSLFLLNDHLWLEVSNDKSVIRVLPGDLRVIQCDSVFCEFRNANAFVILLV